MPEALVEIESRREKTRGRDFRDRTVCTVLNFFSRVETECDAF